MTTVPSPVTDIIIIFDKRLNILEKRIEKIEELLKSVGKEKELCSISMKSSSPTCTKTKAIHCKIESSANENEKMESRFKRLEKWAEPSRDGVVKRYILLTDDSDEKKFTKREQQVRNKDQNYKNIQKWIEPLHDKEDSKFKKQDDVTKVVCDMNKADESRDKRKKKEVIFTRNDPRFVKFEKVDRDEKRVYTKDKMNKLKEKINTEDVNFKDFLFGKIVKNHFNESIKLNKTSTLEENCSEDKEILKNDSINENIKCSTKTVSYGFVVEESEDETLSNQQQVTHL